MKEDKDFIAANDPEHYNELSARKKAVLLVWIMSNIEPHRTKGYRCIRSSYRLKHDFERSRAGFYITNGQFKKAMMLSGFEPKDRNALNWHFTVGKNAGKELGWKRCIPSRHGTRGVYQ